MSRALELAKFNLQITRTTFSGKQRKQYVESIPTYEGDVLIGGKKHYVFGRFDFPKIMASFNAQIRFIHHRTTGQDQPLELAPTFNFLDYQERIIDHIIDQIFTPKNVDENSASCLLELGTGRGKTFIAGGLIHRIRGRAIIIVPRINLQDQASADLQKMFPNARISTVPEAPSDITILVYITASNQPPEYFNQFQLAIFDEFPFYCTPQYRHIFRMAKTVYSIGMSATPERRDSMHRIAEIYLGPIIKESTFNIVDMDFTIDTEFVGYMAIDPPTPIFNKTTKAISYMESSITCLSYDNARNALIVNLSERLLKAGHPHFVFTLTIVHAHTLSRMIAHKLDIPDNQIKTIAGGSASSDPYYSLRDSTIVVGTYQGTGVGISIVGMTGAIFAMMPFSTQIDQVYGRIKRVNADNPEANLKPRKVYVIEDYAYRWLKPHYADLRDRLKPKNKIEIDTL